MESSTAAMVTTSARWERAELAGKALRLAWLLRRSGIRGGERVLLRADNSPPTVIALLALMHLDASIVLLDDRQTAEECTRVARASATRWVLDRQSIDLGDGVRRLALDELLTDSVGAADPELSFDAWHRRSDALVTWSSGSTGAPKGIVRSGHVLLDDVQRSQQRMGYRSDDVFLPLVPFSHFYGLTLVLTWWRLDCTLVVAQPGRLDQALRIGAEAGVTVVDATPPTYHSILSLTDRRPGLRENLASVRMWCVGGSPLSDTFADRFAAVFGLPILDGYGSNEAGNVALASLDNPSGCGRPLPGVQVAIVDEAGLRVSIGSTGEILVRTPGMMAGYLAEDGSTVPSDSDLYRTQDLGYWDAHGNLHVVGRKSAVHRLGHTLYPEAIERRVEACGRPVKIVSLDDERRGCQLVFVIADPDNGSAQFWRREIDQLLPAYEQPNRVVVVEQFPLNANGKPDMAELRRLATATRTLQPRPGAVANLDLTGVPFPQRVRAIDDVLAFLHDQPEQVAEILTEISVRRAVDDEIEASTTTLEGAVEEVRRNRPNRVGQSAVFMSSNVLLYSYVLYALVPALFTERITLRPSSQVAEQTRKLHDLLAPLHRLPVEVCSLSQRRFVEGPVAESDLVVFTGAYDNAEQVRGKLRRDQLFLFFGQGINPFVVGPDADGERAVEDALRIRMLNSGQDCFGPDVFFVHRSMQDQFIDGLVKRCAEQRYGPYHDPRTDYGALCYDAAIRSSTEYLLRNRQFIRQGGQVEFGSGCVPPTVLVRDIDDAVEISEFFSPIFNVVVYEDESRLRQTLFSPYFAERAMGAMLYGVDPELADKLRERHAVAVNATLLEIDNGNYPFGGRGIMANYAAYAGKRHAEPLLISKSVAQYGIGA